MKPHILPVFLIGCLLMTAKTKGNETSGTSAQSVTANVWGAQQISRWEDLSLYAGVSAAATPYDAVWEIVGFEKNLQSGNPLNLTYAAFNYWLGESATFICTVYTDMGQYSSAPYTVTLGSPPPTPPTNSVSITSNKNLSQLCEGESVTFSANVQNTGQGVTYTWFIGYMAFGTEGTQNSVTLNESALSEYTPKVDSGGIKIYEISVNAKVQYPGFNGYYYYQSDKLRFEFNRRKTSSAGISPSSAVQLCADSYRLTATVGGFSEPYTYLWKNNGVPIPGAINDKYYDVKQVGTANISVTVKGQGSCVTQDEVTSNTVSVTLFVREDLRVNLSKSSESCSWGDMVLNAVVTPPATDHRVTWSVGSYGKALPNASPSPFSFQWDPSGDWAPQGNGPETFTCSVTPGNVCLKSRDGVSESITATIRLPETNSVRITSNKESTDPKINHLFCSYESITFTAHPEHEEYVNKYTWYINHQLFGTAKSNQKTITLTNADLAGYPLVEFDESKIYGYNIYVVTNTEGASSCLQNGLASNSIAFRSIAPPPAPTILPVNRICGGAELKGASGNAYWQTTPQGTGTQHIGNVPYTVTSPGTYYLRAVDNGCWGSSSELTVLATDIDSEKPILSPDYECDYVELAIENKKSGYTYYFQPNADARDVSSPFAATVTECRDYIVKGADNNGSWGCASDPVTVRLLSCSGTTPTQNIITLTSPHAGGTVKACEGIVLGNGFSFSTAGGKSLLLTIDKATCGPTDIPVNISGNRNYILTVIPQDITKDMVLSECQITLPHGVKAITELQYFDGLGRTEQTVAVGASPSGKDIVVPFEYDAFGRQAKQYLPYTANTKNGEYHEHALAAQQNFYAAPPTGTPADAVPWSETIFEPSPLNRVKQQYGPGEAWREGTGHPARTDYLTNEANTVKQWKINGTTVDGNSWYAAGTLYRTDSYDEDGRRSAQYTDKQEKPVASANEKNDTLYLTHYVYDDYGRLRYVLPPDFSGDVFSENEPNVYMYRYDERGRVIAKNIPGAGNTSIVYNKLDQPVLTQDAEQLSRNEWSYTKYDAAGRVVLTGLYKPDAAITQADMTQHVYDAASQFEKRAANADNGYTRTAFPTDAAKCEVLTINYYDDYDFDRNNTPDHNYAGASPKTHGLPTGSKTKILETADEMLLTIMFYDEKGRVIHTATDQTQGVKDKVTNRYDFVGKLISSNRELTGTKPLNMSVTNKYDGFGRLLTEKYKPDGGDTVAVAQNRYNELGQLIETKLHQGMETVGYGYNIRGWLKKIDSKNFKQFLSYHESVSGLDNIPQWAGNISASEWHATGMDADWHAYAFEYDDLNRLKSGNYKEKATQGAAYGNTQIGFYDENYTYDIMGNFAVLKRRSGNKPGSNSHNITDDLHYFYANNRVSYIRDYSNITLGFEDKLKQKNVYYEYDPAGRLKKDKNTGADYLYNHLGLMKQATKGTQKLEYTYDASGRRLIKKFGATERYYMDGIERSGDTLWVHTPYGRLRKAGSGAWNYDYFLKDHLGNVRVVLTAEPANASGAINQTIYTASMEEVNSGEENTYFDNVENTRADRPYNYPDKNPINVKLAKVPGKSRGPSIMLKVMGGDTIDISVKAFYNIDKTLPGQGTDIAPVAAGVVAAVANPSASAAGEASIFATDLGTTVSQSANLLQVPNDDDDKKDKPQPVAGLNFVLYNSSFEIIEENTGVLNVEDKINQIQTLTADRMVIKEAGFLEVFANNDAQTPVYFDNMTVTQTVSRVTEVNAYYPYGMIIPQLSMQSLPAEKNLYKYNGKELQKELNLGWLDYGARMYDPTIGRWWVPDPLADFMQYSWTPYHYCLNNPVLHTDPDGKIVPLLVAIAAKAITGAVIDAGVQVGVQMVMGSTFTEAVEKIDYTSVVAAGVISGVSVPGISTTVKTVAKVTAVAVDAAVDVSEEKGVMHIGGKEDKNKSIGAVVTDVVAGAAGNIKTTEFKGGLEVLDDIAQGALVGNSGVVSTSVKKTIEPETKPDTSTDEESRKRQQQPL